MNYWSEKIKREEAMNDFEVKDSGQRELFSSGMVRDTSTGKTDYTLALDGPMFKRWAEHLTKGAVKYKKRNWMQARGVEEYERFKESALRHFVAYLDGQTDEDHAAGVFFNINGMEYTKQKMRESVVLEPVTSDKSAEELNRIYGQYDKDAKSIREDSILEKLMNGPSSEAGQQARPLKPCPCHFCLAARQRASQDAPGSTQRG